MAAPTGGRGRYIASVFLALFTVAILGTSAFSGAQDSHNLDENRNQRRPSSDGEDRGNGSPRGRDGARGFGESSGLLRGQCLADLLAGAVHIAALPGFGSDGRRGRRLHGSKKSGKQDH